MTNNIVRMVGRSVKEMDSTSSMFFAIHLCEDYIHIPFSCFCYSVLSHLTKVV